MKNPKFGMRDVLKDEESGFNGRVCK